MIVEDLKQLFQQTAHDHHAAFVLVDGVDPDWPLWYASRLRPRFEELLGVAFTRSEIVALLLDLAHQHQARGAGQPWASFYAEVTAERYASS